MPSKALKIASTIGLQFFLPANIGIDWDIATSIAIDSAHQSPIQSEKYNDIYQEIIDIVDPMIEETLGYHADKHVALAYDRSSWVVTTIETIKSIFSEIIDEYWSYLEKNIEDSSKPELVKRVTKSLITTEIGLLTGYLSNKVLAQYDLLIPNSQNSYLYFIEPNIQSRIKQLKADSVNFRFWITLHELAHKYQFDHNPWIKEHYLKLISETKKIIKKPVKDNQFSYQFNLIITPSNRGIISKIQAFMSVIEGYADYVMFTVGRKLPGYNEMAPIFQRKKTSGGPLKELLNKLLGFDLKLNQYKAGYKFISEVAKLQGIEFLHQNLSDSQSLPTLSEINNPNSWIKRMINR